MVLESPEAEKPKVVNGREMVWTSHTNAKAAEEIRFYEGKIFGPANESLGQRYDHEILSSLEVCISIIVNYHAHPSSHCSGW